MKQEFTYAPDLLKKMENIRNRYVKHWKTDFYHDVRTIMNLWMDGAPYKGSYNGWKPFAAVWLVRENGTHLFILNEGEKPFENPYVKCVLDNYGNNVRAYLIEGEVNKPLNMTLTLSSLAKPC
jgi:hypothetical protein